MTTVTLADGSVMAVYQSYTWGEVFIGLMLAGVVVALVLGLLWELSQSGDARP